MYKVFNVYFFNYNKALEYGFFLICQGRKNIKIERVA